MAPIQFVNAATREAKGITAALAQKEIGPVLTHMGFEQGKDFIYEDHWKLWWQKGWPPPNTNYKFVIFTNAVYNLSLYMAVHDLKKSSLGFELAGASIIFKRPEQRYSHAIAGFIQSRKGYIFDSAGPFDIVECDWWNAKELERFIKNRYGAIEYIKFAYLLYTNKAYTDKIAPFCRRKYKKLTGAVRNEVKREVEFAYKEGKPLYSALSNRLRRPFTTPATRAALMKQHGQKKLLTQRAFDALVRIASSYQNGMNTLKNMVQANYTYNANGNNFKNFKLKLLAKFPRPLPAFFYKTIYERGVRNKHTTAKQFHNRLENYALMLNYSINKNNKAYKNFVSAVNRYTSGTRSAVKRATATPRRNSN